MKEDDCDLATKKYLSIDCIASSDSGSIKSSIQNARTQYLHSFDAFVLSASKFWQKI